MVEKAIWLSIALLHCIFTRLRLVKIWMYNRAIPSHIAFTTIKYMLYGRAARPFCCYTLPISFVLHCVVLN